MATDEYINFYIQTNNPQEYPKEYNQTDPNIPSQDSLPYD
jgi:hypothetical protein